MLEKSELGLIQGGYGGKGFAFGQTMSYMTKEAATAFADRVSGIGIAIVILITMLDIAKLLASKF